MAGTSGCIPTHTVNFFSRLCGPRPPTPSTSTSASDPNPEPEPETQLIDQQPAPQRTTASKPDRIAELFQENQTLIRSYSPANIDIFEATLKRTFKEVQQERAANLLPTEQAETHYERAEERCQGGQHINDDDDHQTAPVLGTASDPALQPLLHRNTTHTPNPALGSSTAMQSEHSESSCLEG